MAVAVDLVQRRGGDFIEGEMCRQDQEFVVLAWHARRRMRHGEIRPAIERREPEDCSKFDACSPFFRGDLVLEARRAHARFALSLMKAHTMPSAR